jgi:hypothetical protein
MALGHFSTDLTSLGSLAVFRLLRMAGFGREASSFKRLLRGDCSPSILYGGHGGSDRGHAVERGRHRSLCEVEGPGKSI